MPNSLKCKIKHLRHNGTLTERECDRILKALEQQPCEDCISRKDVLAMKRLFIDEDGVMAYAVPTGNILRLQPVTPTGPTGKWIEIGNEGLVSKCSLCGMKTTIESHYCPNCGARMTESEGDIDEDSN